MTKLYFNFPSDIIQTSVQLIHKQKKILFISVHYRLGICLRNNIEQIWCLNWELNLIFSFIVLSADKQHFNYKQS